jgi:hypothetical protein
MCYESLDHGVVITRWGTRLQIDAPAGMNTQSEHGEHLKE